MGYKMPMAAKLWAVSKPTMNERDAMIRTGLRWERWEEMISVAPVEKIIFLRNMIPNIATARLTEIPFFINELLLFFAMIMAAIMPMGREIKKAE